VVEDLSPRRLLILEAATAVLAREGGRGLTHRAVDREAGLPEGSSSAYFRSRASLVSALGELVAARLAKDVADLGAALARRPDDHDGAVEATASLVTTWLARPQDLMARFELTLMAMRDPELAARLEAWRIDLVGIVERVLRERRTGSLAVDADVLVAAFEGLLLTALRRPPGDREEFARAGIEQLLEIQPHDAPD
jgi:DNA-binding transcriptional regulator YbjK